jgi:hypothetical protein
MSELIRRARGWRIRSVVLEALGPALIGALALASACVHAKVVSKDDRAVGADAPERSWRPAEAADVHGLYESVSIEGEAAAALWRIYYHFAEDGTYTGAALTLGGVRPEFQTLSGTWTLADSTIEFDSASMARAEVAGDELRLLGEGGIVILKRTAIQ